jgi:hypothetical protein
MTDIATLQMLPVDEEEAELGLRCKFTTQTICTAITCNTAPDTYGEFRIEIDE